MGCNRNSLFFLHSCNFRWEDSTARDNPKDGWNHLKSRSLTYLAFDAAVTSVGAINRNTPCSFFICPVFSSRMMSRVVRLLYCNSGSTNKCPHKQSGSCIAFSNPASKFSTTSLLPHCINYKQISSHPSSRERHTHLNGRMKRSHC